MEVRHDMASNEDITIKAVAELDQAIKDLNNLKKAIKETAQESDGSVGKSTSGISGKVSAVGNKIKGVGAKIKGALSTEAAMAFAAAGAAATAFAKDCINSAIKSESAWNRFGAVVRTNGGDWDGQKKQIKGWVSSFSNDMGRSVSDTRAAATALMDYGVQYKNLEPAMKGVAGLAARAGITEEEASSTIISALNGRGMALQKLTGLRMEDYKNADGSINQEKLLNDIYNQNKDAVDAYANSTEGQMNKMQNSIGSLKTEIGNALLPILKMVVPIITQVVDAFKNAPEPVKQLVAALLVIGGAIGVVIGALGFIAGPLMSLGAIISAIAEAGGALAFLSGIGGTLAAAFPALAGAIGAVGGVLLTIAPYIAIVIAAFVALYALGKYLGWWDDLGGMMKKVGETLSWLGGQVLGFAKWLGLLFTDFPAAMAQLQAWLGTVGPMIMDALSGLGDWIMDSLGQIGGWIMSALGSIDLMGLITTAFPIVGVFADLFNQAGPGVMEAVNGLGQSIADGLRQLPGMVMDALGNLGTIITDALSSIGDAAVPGGGLTAGIMAIFAPLPTLIYGALSQIWPMVAPAIMQLVTNVINGFVGIGQGIWNAFASIPTMIGQFFTQMVLQIQLRLQQARVIANMAINMLRMAIVNTIMGLVNRVRMLWVLFVQHIQTQLNRARAIAGNLAGMIRQVIVTRIQAVVNKVRTFFQNVVSTVRQKLADAVSAARDKAREIYDNIKNKIQEIPQMVADEFGKIPDKIRSALANAAAQAAAGARNIVSSFASALGIASPGHVQRLTAWEFEETANRIGAILPTARDNAGRLARGIVDAYTRNMPDLFDVAGMNGFDAFNPLNAIYEANRNGLLQTGIANPQQMNQALLATNGTTTNNNTNTTDNRKTIIVEKVENNLDCKNMTTTESRNLLYKALDGLYTGGV